LPAEATGPLEVRFKPRPLGAGPLATPRPAVPEQRRTPETVLVTGDLTAGLDWNTLHQGLSRQRQRRPRIPLPAGQAHEVRWGLLCRTYQPGLAAGWSACTTAFAREADEDPVFEAHVFWVVTQAMRCFY
jgi:hypothetical protein